MATSASIIICTLNRAAYSRQAVESLRHQTLTGGWFEIIVVDNGSNDETPDVMARLAKEIPSLRYVREERLGLSNARNRGISEANGEVVLFLDDDAVAAPGWIDALVGAMSHQDVAAVGGRILLRWPGARPDWVPTSAESLYSGFDLGEQLRPLVYPQCPFGANMAIRRSTFAEVGGFSPALGRRGSSLISSEERDLFHRISRWGGQMLYVPDAVVHHHVMPERMTRRWLLLRSFEQGRSEILFDTVTQGAPTLRRRVGRVLVHGGRAARGAAQALGAVALRRGQPRAMEGAIRMLRWLGSALESTRVAGSLLLEPPPLVTHHERDC